MTPVLAQVLQAIEYTIAVTFFSIGQSHFVPQVYDHQHLMMCSFPKQEELKAARCPILMGDAHLSAIAQFRQSWLPTSINLLYALDVGPVKQRKFKI